MAKFLKIKLQTGGEPGESLSGAKGTHVIVASAEAWTGRVARINKVKAVSSDEPEKTATATVTQKGSNIFKFTKNNLTTESGTVVFGGEVYETSIKTNAEGIKIEEVETQDCTFEVLYNDEPLTIDGESQAYKPADDPGASGEYELKIKVTVPLNEDANEVVHTINIKSVSDAETTCVLTLTQAQSTPTISLTPQTAEIAFNGGEVELTLTTNDDWSATVEDNA